ncbi:MAG: hypothetical protein HWN81_00490 [Candidatus Lokiarchaeota archaeon]|nr:hypothetical protein [Candidatus Lokiarchaeota archaeon]
MDWTIMLVSIGCGIGMFIFIMWFAHNYSDRLNKLGAPIPIKRDTTNPDLQKIRFYKEIDFWRKYPRE